MPKTVRSLKDGWEVWLSIFALIGSIVVLIVSDKARTEVMEENERLRYSLQTACQYIDSLPKKHRAVFDFCIDIEKKEVKR